MILKRVPTPILLALGLGCGPTANDDASTSACLSPPYDDDGTEVGPCLSECLGMLPTTDEGTTTSAESDVGPCLDVSSCLEPPLDTSTGTSESGGFISASSDTSGDSDSGTTGGSGSESGSESGTTGGAQDASPRARSWHAALQRMADNASLPSDVLARLRAQKGPR